MIKYNPQKAQFGTILRKVSRNLARKVGKPLLDYPRVKPTPEERAFAKSAKSDHLEWLNSTEWLNRRMAGTGEDFAAANYFREQLKHKMRNIKVTMRDTGIEAPKELGLATDNLDFYSNPRVNIARNINGAYTPEEVMFHELGHAERMWAGAPGRKGIKFLKVKKSPRMADDQANLVEKLNDTEEQRIRAMATLKYLKDSGQWSGKGSISDNAMHYLNFKARFSDQLPGDVKELATYMPKAKYLKPLLNTAYSGFGAAVINEGLTE